MAASMFHIVDGESTGGTLRVAGFRSGEILVWRDALYTGPVPAELSLRQLSRLRSRFWTKGRSTTEFDKRDVALPHHANHDQIVLWFGSRCTLCQLSLMQLLSWFRERKVNSGRLSWVQEHGGCIPPEKMLAALSSRRPITSSQMALSVRVWKAFRSASPELLNRLLKSDLGAIPGIRRAILWVLQEYPWKRDGLSRLERKLLRSFRTRGDAQAAIAVGAVPTQESVGDLLLFDMLRKFVAARHPLLQYAEPFNGKFNSYQFNSAKLRLTETGRRVLAGKDDHVALNGIDRWTGGVHLRGHRARWRWDPQLHRVASVPS
jgi:hypothetical protein